jgi:hypothetical protein
MKYSLTFGNLLLGQIAFLPVDRSSILVFDAMDWFTLYTGFLGRGGGGGCVSAMIDALYW